MNIKMFHRGLLTNTAGKQGSQLIESLLNNISAAMILSQEVPAVVESDTVLTYIPMTALSEGYLRYTKLMYANAALDMKSIFEKALASYTPGVGSPLQSAGSFVRVVLPDMMNLQVQIAMGFRNAGIEARANGAGKKDY